MAYDFNGSSDAISLGTGSTYNPATFSISVWANLDTWNGLANETWLFSRADETDGFCFAFGARLADIGSGAHYYLSLQVNTGLEQCLGPATQLDSMTGVWLNLACVATNGNFKTYINGTQEDTDTSAVTPATTTGPTTVGQRSYSGNQGWTNGRIAEVGFWNAILDAGEIATLAKGYSPAAIRPGNLLSYVPLVRSLVDRLGPAPTLIGTPTAGFAHPRIIMPRRAKIGGVRLLLFLRPDADDADGAWTNELGNNTNLFASVDETTASDSDYIQSSLTPANDVVRVRLSDPATGVGEPVGVSYRYQKVGSDTINLIVRLKESTTTKATWTHNNISTSLLTANQTLSGGEFASISDWSNLFLEFEADVP